MKKLTYEHIKNYIEKENYQLLSTEYISINYKLKVKCDKGHIYEVRFNDFKNGKRCPICNGGIRLTYKFVKNYIESFNYQLLSQEYKNTESKLKIKCPKGHIYETSHHNFKNGNRCPVCYGNTKHTYKYIKNFIKKENYQLLSKEYIGANSKLKVKCDKGHEYEVTFGNFQQGCRCPICRISNITSKGEKEVLDYIQNIYNGKIIENDRKTVKNPLTNHYLELDILLPEIKFAIEYNGEYWHSKTKAIKKDKIKVEQCNKLDITLLVINENDWKNNNDKCLNKLNKAIISIK